MQTTRPFLIKQLPELASWASASWPSVTERWSRAHRTRPPSDIVLSPSCWLSEAAKVALASALFAADIEHQGL